jgi:hypothetical protein
VVDRLLFDATILITALLFGGMLLFSAGFAAFLFKVLPSSEARFLIRQAFPRFHLFVIGSATLASLFCWWIDGKSTLILGAIAISTIPTRQLLMPAINAATDWTQKRRFNLLHSLSVLITLSHIVAAGIVMIRLANL